MQSVDCGVKSFRGLDFELISIKGFADSNLSSSELAWSQIGRSHLTLLENEGGVKKNEFERRAAEMRDRNAGKGQPSNVDGQRVVVLADRSKSDELTERTYNLSHTAVLLGVSYSTARRLCNQENVRRYSTTSGDVVYPGSKVKRFQRVRLTYVVTESDIDRIRNKMRGVAAYTAATLAVTVSIEPLIRLCVNGSSSHILFSRPINFCFRNSSKDE